MSLSPKGRLLVTKGRLLRRVVGGVVLTAALAACGGGTEQKDPFNPGRLIVFGDENSLLTSDGRRWSINHIDEGEDGSADDALACTGNPIWVQRLASRFGFVFAECNPDEKEPKAFFRSQQDARVAAIESQIAAQVAAGGFNNGDLTTVMLGAHDILDLYAQYPTRSAAELKIEADARGSRLAAQVNRLVDLGAKVILSNVPDMGLTPFALAEDAANGSGRARLLSELTQAFNDALEVNILLDGRYIGLVRADLRVQVMERSPGSFNITDEQKPACLASAPLPDCSTQTLVDKANSSNHLWADATHLGPNAHGEIAELAIDRAEDNPF